MNKTCFISILLGFLLIGFQNKTAQSQTELDSPVLFVDRDYCVSGDTVWFKIFYPDNSYETGNVIRVQLDNKKNNLIANVAVLTHQNWANGYLHIPDSLSTGQYFLTAYLNAHRNINDLQLESKSLLVYNRFEEHVAKINIADPSVFDDVKENNNIVNINSERTNYKTRENVKISFEFEEQIIPEFALVKVALIDPLAKQLERKYAFKYQSLDLKIPDFAENNGFLLSGQVTDKNGNPESGVLVLLSLSSETPYLDYYLTDENGNFHFYMKNAFGKTNIVLQTVGESLKDYHIKIQKNAIIRSEDFSELSKILENDQVDFIKNAIESSFVNKLFNPSITVQQEDFIFPERFSTPFYGQFDARVFPAEFEDLPDFKEISRELLPGVQYRERNEEISIRLINNDRGMYFGKEPLRLINGIPVFDNKYFTPLKSTDIDYVDIVKDERIYGDLIMEGVFSVMLHDKSNSWLIKQPGLFRFETSFLQHNKEKVYSNSAISEPHYPDTRQVYYWELINPENNNEIEFNLSDRKGRVEILISGFKQNGEFFKSTKIIKVE